MIEILKGTVYLGTATPESGGGGTTINNQDLYVTSNGTYSADVGYTGLGTVTVDLPLSPKSISENGTYYAVDDSLQGFSDVTVNVPQGDIVTATNTTGSAIAEGDKVWLNKVSGGWNIVPFYATDLNFKYLNYRDITFVGAPNVDYNLVANGFSASKYFTGPTLTNIDPNHCIIYFRFEITSTTNGQCIIDGSITAQINNSGKLCLWNNRTSSLDSFFSVSTNTKYWTKVVINGAERTVYYKTSASADYTLSGTQTAELNTSNKYVVGTIGYSQFASYLRGDFFFNTFEIHDVNDNIVWTAYKYDINTTDKSLSGFALENIAVNGTGNVKTILPEEQNG